MSEKTRRAFLAKGTVCAKAWRYGQEIEALQDGSGSSRIQVRQGPPVPGRPTGTGPEGGEANGGV